MRLSKAAWVIMRDMRQRSGALAAASGSKCLCNLTPCEQACFTEMLLCKVYVHVHNQPSKNASLVHRMCITCCPT